MDVTEFVSTVCMLIFVISFSLGSVFMLQFLLSFWALVRLNVMT